MKCLCVALLLLVMASSLLAQAPPLGPLADVAIEQRLSAQIPLDVELRDETGQPVALKQFFNHRPVIFMLVYYECPMLCGLVLNGVLESANVLNFIAGQDFEVVAVSFDPSETPQLAAAKKDRLLKQYGLNHVRDGWHFLTGDEDAIRSITEATGFRYTWDAETSQWAHGGAIMILTPEGRLSRYFFGVEYPPRDLRLALVEASEGKIGSFIDRALLYCFHYDPLTGRYGLVIMNSIRVAGLATVAALATWIILMLRREKRLPVASAGRK